MNLQRAKEIIAGFSSQNILVIGDVVLDRYIYGKVERLNPEAPVPILHAREEKCATGGAGNTAKNAAVLGVRATCIGVTGSDDIAGRLEQQAKEEGYNPILTCDSSRPTIQKIRYIVGTQQMLRVDYEEIKDVTGDIEEQIIGAIQKAAADATGIVVSDYAKGVITERVSQAIMSVAKSRGIPVMADVKPSRINYFTGATYVSPNRKEAHEFLGLNPFENGGKGPEELSKMLLETFNTTVFLTLSEQGMYVLGKEGNGQQVPQVYVKSDEVLDPSGCGDTAALTILLAKLAGAEDVEAADLANAAAAVVAHKIGSVGLSQEELIDIMVHHEEHE